MFIYTNLIIIVDFYWTYMYKYIQEEVLKCGKFIVVKSTTYKYDDYIGEVAEN